MEIVADEAGIDELIQYLEGIKRDKDHMHLIIDTELDAYPIEEGFEHKVFCAKHVRLEFAHSNAWK